MGVYGEAQGRIVFRHRAAALALAREASPDDDATTIEEFLITVLGEDGEFADDGTFWVNGKLSSRVDDVVDAIQPCVEPGSYIEWRIEDGSWYREVFTGDRLQTIYPVVSWPEVTITAAPPMPQWQRLHD